MAVILRGHRGLTRQPGPRTPPLRGEGGAEPAPPAEKPRARATVIRSRRSSPRCQRARASQWEEEEVGGQSR